LDGVGLGEHSLDEMRFVADWSAPREKSFACARHLLPGGQVVLGCEPAISHPPGR
jgi:hypothetical protein